MLTLGVRGRDEETNIRSVQSSVNTGFQEECWRNKYDRRAYVQWSVNNGAGGCGGKTNISTDREWVEVESIISVLSLGCQVLTLCVRGRDEETRGIIDVRTHADSPPNLQAEILSAPRWSGNGQLCLESVPHRLNSRQGSRQSILAEKYCHLVTISDTSLVL